MCVRATAASALARTGGGTRPFAGGEMTSQGPVAGKTELIYFLGKYLR